MPRTVLLYRVFNPNRVGFKYVVRYTYLYVLRFQPWLKGFGNPQSGPLHSGGRICALPSGGRICALPTLNGDSIMIFLPPLSHDFFGKTPWFRGPIVLELVTLNVSVRMRNFFPLVFSTWNLIFITKIGSLSGIFLPSCLPAWFIIHDPCFTLMFNCQCHWFGTGLPSVYLLLLAKMLLKKRFGPWQTSTSWWHKWDSTMSTWSGDHHTLYPPHGTLP